MFPKDKTMQSLYERVVSELGNIEPFPTKEEKYYFSDLCESIIGQQLSVKVADVIIQRVKDHLGVKILTVEIIKNADTEELRKLGNSYSKISYMKNLAEHWLNGSIKYNKFSELSDEEIINELVQVKGIGKWTAEMFLIFTLGRQDVFSAGDLILRNFITKNYRVGKKPKLSVLEKKSFKWKPYRTLASRTIWKALQLPSN